jgi:hypothetical protein
MDITTLRTGDTVIRTSSRRRYIVNVWNSTVHGLVISARIENNGRATGRIFPVTQRNAGEWVADPYTITKVCERCGGTHRGDQSCGCFDNDCQ